MSYFVLLVCLLYLYVNLIGFFVVVVCNHVKNNMFNMQSLKMSKTLKKITDSESKAINMRWMAFYLTSCWRNKTMEIGPMEHGVLMLTQICVKSVQHHSVMHSRKVTSRIASKHWKILSIHVMTFSRTWVDLHRIQLLDFLRLKLKCANLY